MKIMMSNKKGFTFLESLLWLAAGSVVLFLAIGSITNVVMVYRHSRDYADTLQGILLLDAAIIGDLGKSGQVIVNSSSSVNIGEISYDFEDGVLYRTKSSGPEQTILKADSFLVEEIIINELNYLKIQLSSDEIDYDRHYRLSYVISQ